MAYGYGYGLTPTAADSVETTTGQPPAETDLSPLEIYRLKRAAYQTPEDTEETTAPPITPQQDDDTVTNTNNSILTAIGAPISSDEEQDILPYSNEGRSRIVTASGSTAKVIIPQPNPLHAYASYTYGITLHMLSRDDFNAMASDPNSDWNPTTTLIATGGKYGTVGFNRDPAFEDDFFIDNLKMTTIIGSTAGNQGTNAIEVSFTITEPYGMTLIDRLIDACVAKTTAEGQGLVDGNNYIEIPYLLQIDFFGYDNDGIAYELRKQRKYIPINLLGVKIKVGVSGAVYEVSAGIYAHRAFQESIVACPANFEVTASTLEEFFKPDINVEDLNKKFDERYEQYKKEKKAQEEKEGPDARTTDQGVEVSAGDSTYEVRSFVAAYNAWQSRLKENNVAQDFNTIRVVFDEEILANGGGKITAPKTDSVKQVATSDPKNPKQKGQVAKANAGQQTAKPNLNINKFTFKTGTGTTQIINMMMLNTEYIRSQVIDTTLDAEQNANKFKKDVNWWKIVPSVKMRSFCTQTSTWYLDVTFHVVKKTVYNRTHPALSTSLPTGVHKEYNYIYTGQNSDIVDFSIEYDALWYTAVSVDKNKSQAVTTSAAPEGIDELDTNDPDAVKPNAKRAKDSPPQPVKQVPVSGQAGAQASGNATKDSVATGASSAADHLNNGQGADQLQVSLKIVGDPQFIKQDEVFANPEARQLNPDDAGNTTGNVGDEEGSIDMDSQEIHALLTWKTPVDIDEDTGGLRNDSKYNESVFSGIFNILSVASTFSGGKFEQTLDMVRLPDQPRDYKNASSSRSLSEREVGKTQPGIGTDDNTNRYESVLSKVVDPEQSAMNVASSNWTPQESASEDDSGSDPVNQQADADANTSTAYVDQTNRSVLSAIVGNNTTPVEAAAVDTFPQSTPTAQIISTSPVVQSSISSPASSAITDATPVPVGYGATTNITDAQAQSSTLYNTTYNNNIALGVPPLLAAKQASDAAKQAIALGN
jgi:hypothetical protein